MSEKKYRIEIGYIILTETSVFEKKHFLEFDFELVWW